MRKLDKLGYRYPRGESYLDVLQRHAPPAPARAPCRCQRRSFTGKRFRLKPGAIGARRCGLLKCRVAGCRLDTIIHELERQRDPVLIIAHQGILRIIYGSAPAPAPAPAPACAHLRSCRISARARGRARARSRSPPLPPPPSPRPRIASLPARAGREDTSCGTRSRRGRSARTCRSRSTPSRPYARTPTAATASRSASSRRPSGRTGRRVPYAPPFCPPQTPSALLRIRHSVEMKMKRVARPAARGLRGGARWQTEPNAPDPPSH